MAREEYESGELHGDVWLGPGTWLIDRRHYRPRLGVITDVQERNRDMDSRLAIRWRDNCYQNLDLKVALGYFKSGVWRLDHGE